MKFLTFLLLQILHLLPLVTATPITNVISTSASPSSLTLDVIYEFPKNAYAENLAVRSNGNLLVVRLDVPEIWEINPILKSGYLVHKFPKANRVTGITEVRPDVFVVAVGKMLLNTVPTHWSIWELAGVGNQFVVRAVVSDFKGAGLLNGITNLKSKAVLVSDLLKGQIWRVDLESGRYEIAVTDTTSSTGIAFGLNGIQRYNNTVYFSNTIYGVIGSFNIDPVSGKPTTPPRTLIWGQAGIDDFAISDNGQYLCTCNQLHHSVVKIDLGNLANDTVNVAGNSGLLVGPTAAAFGRTPGRERVLYVTTAGMNMIPLIGTTPKREGVGGGKVLAIGV